MSRQRKLSLSKIGNTPAQHNRLRSGISFGLEAVAAVEKERRRRRPRSTPAKRELVRLACELYESRRSRDRPFSSSLFGEPAWDMLLALYGLPSRGEAIGVTSLGYAANVSPSTALRWQSRLLEDGLIRRGPHVSDARVQLVGLTPKGRKLMEKFLIEIYLCDAVDPAEPQVTRCPHCDGPIKNACEVMRRKPRETFPSVVR